MSCCLSRSFLCPPSPVVVVVAPPPKQHHGAGLLLPFSLSTSLPYVCFCLDPCSRTLHAVPKKTKRKRKRRFFSAAQLCSLGHRACSLPCSCWWDSVIHSLSQSLRSVTHDIPHLSFTKVREKDQSQSQVTLFACVCFAVQGTFSLSLSLSLSLSSPLCIPVMYHATSIPFPPLSLSPCDVILLLVFQRNQHSVCSLDSQILC